VFLPMFMAAVDQTLLATATQDFFDIQGSWTSFREATRIFGILGHAERVNLVEYNTKHGYPKPQREAVTRWMRRWLGNQFRRQRRWPSVARSSVFDYVS